MDGIQIRIGDLLYAVVKRWKLVLALTAMGLGFGVALYGIAFVQGKNMNYEITCSIAFLLGAPMVSRFSTQVFKLIAS